MNELALFAGAGGGILGGKLLGWRTVCAVEIEAYCRNVLMQRQNDGILEPFPIWDDVCTFDGLPWRGKVDIVSGGFPCQDISCAGKGVGITGEKSGLWKEMRRIIGEVQPRFVLVENSPMLVCRGLDVLLGDLAALGYDAEWGVLGADDAGAPHKRKRIWILAHANKNGFVFKSGKRRLEGLRDICQRSETEYRFESVFNKTWPGGPEQASCIPRMADGMANVLERNQTIGNGQVPRVVALAWETLMKGFQHD